MTKFSHKPQLYLRYLLLVGASAVTFAACSSQKAGTPQTPSSATAAKSTTPACAAPFSPSADAMNMSFDKTETFGAQDDAFTLTYPSQPWEVLDNGDFVTMLVNLKVFDARNVLTFMLTPNGGSMTMDQYGNGILTGLKSNPNFKLVEDCMTEINGNPARKIVWTGDSGSFKNVKATEYLIIKGDKSLRIQFESGADYYDKYVGSAEKIIGSLELK